MKTKEKKASYEEWLNPKVMHTASINWLSELRFDKDEELFFDDLVKSYTLQLIDSKYFKESKLIIDQLSDLQKETDILIEKILRHEKSLKIIVDGITQPREEEFYKNEHSRLIIVVSNFQKKHKALKTKLFALIKNILKEGKQKRLLQ